MTNKEKREAILKRVPFLPEDYTENDISFIIVMSYVDALAKLGVFKGGTYNITPMGQTVIAVCQEFDWQPTEEDIDIFVDGLVDEQDKNQFKGFLMDYRNDREELLARLKKFREDRGL